MNQAVSNVEKEMNSKELYKVKDFIGRGSWNKDTVFGGKSGLILASLLPFRRWQGSIKQMT